MTKPAKKWYAVYTKPRWEKKVAELLGRKKIENYCPLNKVERVWSDRKKIVLEPLFTSYVFVHIADIEQLEVKKTDGILNFVYFLAKPAIIKTEEIEVIRNFLSEYDNVRLDKTSVSQNDQVQVTEGPFMNMEGNVLELRRKTIIVKLPSLGHNLIAEIKKSNVKVINTSSKSIGSTTASGIYRY